MPSTRGPITRFRALRTETSGEVSSTRLRRSRSYKFGPLGPRLSRALSLTNRAGSTCMPALHSTALRDLPVLEVSIDLDDTGNDGTSETTRSPPPAWPARGPSTRANRPRPVQRRPSWERLRTRRPTGPRSPSTTSVARMPSRPSPRACTGPTRRPDAECVTSNLTIARDTTAVCRSNSHANFPRGGRHMGYPVGSRARVGRSRLQ